MLNSGGKRGGGALGSSSRKLSSTQQNTRNSARTEGVDSAEQRLLQLHGLEVGDDLHALRRLEVQRFVRLRLGRPAGRMRSQLAPALLQEATECLPGRGTTGARTKAEERHLAAMVAKAGFLASLLLEGCACGSSLQ